MAMTEQPRAAMRYETAGASAPPREAREVENMLDTSRRLNDQLSRAVERIGELRGRLLGLRDPVEIAGNKISPGPQPCELTDLRQNFERIDASVDKLHTWLSDLERI